MRNAEAQFFSENEYKQEVARREAVNREASVSKGDKVDYYIKDLRLSGKYPEENLRGVEADIRKDSEPYQEKQKTLSEKMEKIMHKLRKPVLAVMLNLSVGYLGREIIREVMVENYPEIYEKYLMDDGNKELAEAIRQAGGSEAVKYIEKANTIKSESERYQAIEDAKKHEVLVSGFEKNPEVPSNTDVRSLIYSYPAMYRSNLSELSYKDEVHMTAPEYLASGAKPRPIGGETDRHGNTVRFTKSRVPAGNICWFAEVALPHELAHKSDWANNKLLTESEREQLYLDVLSRVRSSDRFPDSEVEDIPADRQGSLDLKVTEYFAVITAAYFGDSFSVLPYKDRMIVEKLNLKIDPNFKRKNVVNNVRGIENKIQKAKGIDNIYGRDFDK